jgi:hypothetical protein
MNGTPSRRRGRWCAGKVRRVPSNAPHGRILRGPDCKPIKERLRRSLRRHSAPPRAHNIRAPGLRFLRHDGIHRSDVVEFTTKPWGRDRAASRRSAPSPGNRTRREDCALLIVPDEFRPGYFSIRLVASPSRLRRNAQINTHFPSAHRKPERSTLLGSGTFYFALPEKITPGCPPACRGAGPHASRPSPYRRPAVIGDRCSSVRSRDREESAGTGENRCGSGTPLSRKSGRLRQ